MLGTIGWIVIAVVVVGWELVGRFGHGRTPDLGELGALVAMRLSGRIILIVVWVFIGFHLFARYTRP